jgi:CDP-diacylglycerol---serine O-phosphatidyltransferase
MAEFERSSTRKHNLLRRVRRQRLKYVTILPSLITLLNGIFGFAAISFACRGTEFFTFHKIELNGFSVAGYMIFFAMIADMLDGRIARMSQTTSSFGGQLDTICDIISFGIAPALIMLRLLYGKLEELVISAPIIEGFLAKLIWLSAAVYISCAAIRLARFNVENEEDETAHMSFVGLPTPAAAGVITSLVIFHGVMLPSIGEYTVMFGVIENIILYSLPFIAIGVAILMVSRIRYPHFINYYLRGRKPLTHLFWLGAVISLIWLFGLENALVITFCGFALSGFLRWFYHRVLVRKKPDGKYKRPAALTINGTNDEQ